VTDDLNGDSLRELFRLEAEAGVQTLTSSLLVLERDNSAAEQLELCMRAAHSLKGAARIVGLEAGVRLAHAMEDCFVAAQQQRIVLNRARIDLLLSSTDLMGRIADTPADEGTSGAAAGLSVVDACVSALVAILDEDTTAAPMTAPSSLSSSAGGNVSVAVPPSALGAQARRKATSTTGKSVAERQTVVTIGASTAVAEKSDVPHSVARDHSDRVLRVTAENLNRLLGLAGESLVESRWVKPFADSLLRLKRMHAKAATALDTVRAALPASGLDPRVEIALTESQRRMFECQQLLADRLVDLEMFDRRVLNLSHRLYDEALLCRMRPFADGVQGFPRMVRDVAQALGKNVRLEIAGQTTQVDRDILHRLDAPLGHLLRNAVDHGIESSGERVAAGKPAEGVIKLEAVHSSGALHVMVSDDGGGVNVERIRELVIERKLIDPEAAVTLAEAELLEFLFLPGFTVKQTVTEVSGRGVGLDAVRDMVKQVRGVVRIASVRGAGTRFVLQLPVSLSVVRTLLVEIDGEPYAFPLASIVRTMKVPSTAIELLEGRPHVDMDGRRIGLVPAHQVLELDEQTSLGDELSIVVLGDLHHRYGLVVNRFLGERELVVQRLDPQIGKIKNVSAAALMADGSPALIVDVEDLIRSMDRLVAAARPKSFLAPAPDASRTRKRVLVVDDSLTVRELERKLLGSRGYDVEVAVDGMDGWNAVRASHFDLVVTDIDMPRMDGIELVTRINGDPKLKVIPVMVVSYKDRDEDRRRGLEAGAAYYLTKGSFQDDKLVQAVGDLIGEAQA
jgi:two-component system sensor histidine kinase and response regulator WspE